MAERRFGYFRPIIKDIPDEILKDRISLQEERRLFYVGMTRARKLLYLTWARDYGLKRLKKVSPFVLEAFDLAKMPDEFLKTSAVKKIREVKSGILSLDYRAKPD